MWCRCKRDAFIDSINELKVLLFIHFHWLLLPFFIQFTIFLTDNYDYFPGTCVQVCQGLPAYQNYMKLFHQCQEIINVGCNRHFGDS